jgi:L-lysine exporter family protein LysE/ArgO
VLTYFAIGFVIGLLTCIPIGVANVAVIDAAYRHNVARAIAVGIGGAIADGIYSSLGIFGLGPVLQRHPMVPPILYAVSGLVLIIYGVIILRAPPILPAAAEAQIPVSRNQHISTGLIVGLLATLLNPSAVVTWVVIVGSYASGVTTGSGIAWVIGIVIGSLVWFVVVAYLADHGKRVLSGNAIWMTRIVAALVAGYGLFSIGRAGRYLLAL